MRKLTIPKWILVGSILFYYPFAYTQLPTSQMTIDIQNVESVNSTYLDFSPTFFGDRVVFVSSRKKGKIDALINQPYFSLFYAKKSKKSILSSPRPFRIGKKTHFHEGPIAAKGTHKLFLTRNCHEKGHNHAINDLGIFEASLIGEDWEVQKVNFCSDSSSYLHPSYDLTSRQLFFSSNQVGSVGGMDIWTSSQNNEIWTAPSNIGSQVNTKYNEVFPFIYKSNYLFFSTDAYSENGKLDIYLFNIKNNRLVRLPEPINSEYDDFGLVLAPDGLSGFLSSDRPGGQGEDDIYYFTTQVSLTEVNSKVPFTVQLVDNRTKEPISNTGVIISQSKHEKPLYPVEYTNQQGLMQYAVPTNGVYVLSCSKKGYEPAYRYVNADTLRDNQLIVIDLLSESCATKMGNVAHVDQDAPIQDAVVQIIDEVSGKISKTTTNQDGNFYFCIPEFHDYSIILEKESFIPFGKKYSFNEIPVIELIDLDKKTNTKTIVLDQIYYDFNKYNIRKSAASELDKLARLMKMYPHVKVDLVAHTDCRGREKYNLYLSRKRAAAAKSYLIQHGIDASRLSAFGQGESKIRNHCVDGMDCTEEEHGYNRRTEVIFKSNGSDVFLSPAGKGSIQQKVYTKSR